MTAPPDDRWLVLLAAYADDELDPATRERVERMLAAHPEAREALRGQRKLSPGNWRLWAKAEPHLPADDAWAGVLEAVKAGLSPRPKADPAALPRGRWRFAPAVAGIAAGAAAAAWLLAAPAPVPPPAPTPAVTAAPAKEGEEPLAALPMSADEDVDLLRVPGDAARWLPVGVPPLSGKLVLAATDDVVVEDPEPGGAWPTGTPKVTPAPGDSPMLFGPRP